MKKELLISASILLFVASPAFAKDNGNQGKSQGNGSKETQGTKETHGNSGKKDVLGEQVSVTVTVTPTNDPTVTPNITITPTVTSSVQGAQTCDPNAQWKNHGQYVSCVAKQHLGGQVTSQAARSDVGKKNKSGVTPTLSPTVTPTSTPSATPTVTPTNTITPTPSDEPPITSTATTFSINPVENVLSFFKRIGNFFSNLI